MSARRFPEMDRREISQAVIRRLPRYLRYVNMLLAGGVERVSSGGLAEGLGLTASQIRQDLNCFGGFGQQGYGYSTEKLSASISAILGIELGYRAVLIGVGNLGRALLGKFSFGRSGLTIIGAFDIVPELSDVGGVRVYTLDKLSAFLTEHAPEAAVLTLPADKALDMAVRLRDGGVRAIWNFTSTDLQGLGLVVEDVLLSDSLMTLCYRLSQRQPHG